MGSVLHASEIGRGRQTNKSMGEHDENLSTAPQKLDIAVPGLAYGRLTRLEKPALTNDLGWVFLATRGAVEGGYRLGATTPTPLPGAGGRLETTPLTPLPLWLKKITNVLHN